MSTTQQAVSTVPVPDTPEGYLDMIMTHVIMLEREINSAAFGGPNDVPRPALLEAAEAASELNAALPAFIEKLRTVAVGPVVSAVLATQTQPGENGVASNASPRTTAKVNCAALAEEIIEAQNAGVRFTVAQQHQFEIPCPGVASLFSNHGGGGFPRS